MNAKEADQLGAQIRLQLQSGQLDHAYSLLAPILAERTPFRFLDRIGGVVAASRPASTDAFLERVAAERTEGGWVVVASLLRQQLDHELEGVFARCRAFVMLADVWYAADILAERVPGPALVSTFHAALGQLAPWREDANRWVRRTAGVAVHFWAKRSRGAPELATQAQTLLTFLEPTFEEWDLDAVKGIGWGLKTLGRHYPDLVAAWLAEQMAHRRRRPRALMLRKALTYLSDEQRDGATIG